MRQISFRWLGVVALCLLVAASAIAQSEKKDGVAEVQFRKGSELSATEQLAQGKKYLGKMNQIRSKIINMMNKARDDKDIIKLNCLNDKLIRVRGAIKVGGVFLKNLERASATGDTSGRNHEFSKLTIVYQKVVVLGQEAEACVGEEIGYVGKTFIQVDIDDGIPRDDPTVELPPSIPVWYPPIASPVF
jgi:hypothetical protein